MGSLLLKICAIVIKLNCDTFHWKKNFLFSYYNEPIIQPRKQIWIFVNV